MVDSHTPAVDKPRAVNLFALPNGGFEIRDPCYGRADELVDQRGNIHFNPALCAFSTLDEALSWLRDNMAQPVVSKP